MNSLSTVILNNKNTSRNQQVKDEPISIEDALILLKNHFNLADNNFDDQYLAKLSLMIIGSHASQPIEMIIYS